MSTEIVAYIDESGQRSRSTASSDHFIMSAVVMRATSLPASTELLRQLRSDLRRGPGDDLHWKNLKQHSMKLRATELIGQATFLRITSVVVCKRHLTVRRTMDDDQAYLFTLRFLLERLSWLSGQRGGVCTVTLAHVVRFKLAKLRQYEQRLRADQQCNIEWQHLDPRGGRIDQPSRVEQLQLADFVASATAQAFEPDRWGFTERRYLENMAPRLYRGRHDAGAVQSYGLKMHPWNAATRQTYDWVSRL